MKIKRSAIVVPALALALTATAVPAKRDSFVATQPDGTTLTLKRVGDEFSHFTITDDGYIVKQNDKGFYEYANVNALGQVTTTGRRAVDRDARPASDAPFLLDIKTINIEQIAAARRKERQERVESARRSAPQSGLGTFSNNFPKKGDINGLVILVEFADVKFTLDDPASYFHNLLQKDGFDEYGATGCAAEYFRENSTDQFRPRFDLFGPITLPEKMAYYGGNDSNDNDKNPHMMVVHAAQLLDSQIDFSRYDMDKDGYVDNVYIFYAGQGEASGGSEDTVWPHAWELSSGGLNNIIHDGTRINRYACSNEWEGTKSQGKPDGIGTFVHEFSHVMGLPDLYNTTTATTCTPGEWSVMDYGPYNNDGRTPPAYSIFERNAMGWIEPTIIDGPATISLDYIGETNSGCLIPTSKVNEFFLIENRQQSRWDAFIPGHGMLIWHIDYNQTVFDNNRVNNTDSHQYVDIEEACGFTSNSLKEMAGYSFPGTQGVTSFTDDTRPSMRMWNGSGLGLPITDIEESADGIITFNVAGGDLLPTPVADTSIETGDGYFIASWQPVEGALDYFLTVKALYDGYGERVSETASMGSSSTATFPTGWNSTATSTYTTSGNYGKASPSLKMMLTGTTLTTREFDDNIVEISFWAKGQGSNVTSTLEIDCLVNGQWQKIERMTPSSNKGSNYSFDNIPDGAKQARFVFEKTSGNIALDDVVISTADNGQTLEQYDDVSTLGQTSMKVTYDDSAVRSRATDEIKGFSFTVVATDGKTRSRASKPKIVTIGQSSVGQIDADKLAVEVIGSDVHCTGVGSPSVELFDITGRRVDHRFTSANTATLRTPSPGMYILRSGTVIKKIAVNH